MVIPPYCRSKYQIANNLYRPTLNALTLVLINRNKIMEVRKNNTVTKKVKIKTNLLLVDSIIQVSCFSTNLYRSSRPEKLVKKLFLEILQNSQENTCARVSL